MEGLTILDIFPALPKAWEKGSLSGLMAWGGIQVDLAWEKGDVTERTLIADRERKVQLNLNGRSQELHLEQGSNTIHRF